MWAVASIAFVFVYLTFHLRSVFMSAFAMLNIILSFPLSLFFYKMIFQITFFSNLHILAVFIVLGIAADDVFAFMDAWNQSDLYPEL